MKFGILAAGGIAVWLVAAVQTQAVTNTAGAAILKVTTVPSKGGKFSPKHVMAVWVTDDQGTYIRTLMATKSKWSKYLLAWNVASGTNAVDAVTGPTVATHETHEVTWDCKNAAGVVVPDGDYRFWVEFTEKNGKGPLVQLSFQKGVSASTAKTPDQTGYKDVSVTYMPAGISTNSP